MGYGQINTRDLLVHLYTTYGKIGPDNLKKHEKRMKESYDTTEAVEVLFGQIKDAVEFADSAAQPYIDLQVICIVFNLIFETGQFTRSCKKWKKKLPDTKLDKFQASLY